MRIAVMLVLSLWAHWQLLAEAPAPQTQRLSGGVKAPQGLTLVTVSAPAARAEPKPQVKPEPKVSATKPSAQVKPVKTARVKPQLEKKAQQKPVQKPKPASEAVEASAQSTPKPSAQTGLAAEATLIDEPLFRQPPKPPHYPKQARRRNQQGIAEVMAWLDLRGDVTRTQLVRSSGYPALDRAARQAVAGWLFEPLKENGVARPARVQVPVRFFLR